LPDHARRTELLRKRKKKSKTDRTLKETTPAGDTRTATNRRREVLEQNFFSREGKSLAPRREGVDFYAAPLIIENRRRGEQA